MPGKKRSASSKGGAPSKRRRQAEEDDEFDLHGLDGEDFNDTALAPMGEIDGDDADIHFDNRRRVHADETLIDPTQAHKTEAQGIEAGQGDIDKEEAELAAEQQKRKLAGYAEEDFMGDFAMEAAPAKGSKKRSGAAAHQRDMDALSQFLTTAETSFAAEKVSTDYATLSAEDKRALLDKDAPELRAMLADFKEKLTTVRDVLSPTLQKVQDGELETNKGVGFLEMKMHLFLTYLMHLSFYLLLKAEGKPVKGNPVIEKLVELRAYIDKLKPVEKKLHHQISRLLSRAAVRAAGGTVAGTDKPNLDALADASDDGETTTYVAQKHGGARLSKDEKRLREDRLLSMAAKAKGDMEEGQMARATTTRKKDKILKNAKANFSLPSDDGDDEEGAGIDPMLAGTLADPNATLMSRVKQRQADKIVQQQRMQEEDEEESDEEGDEGDEEGEEGEEEAEEGELKEFLAEELARVDGEKRRKKRVANENRQFGGKKEEDLGQRAGEVLEGHRKISKEITKNRGLVPERKKKFKNPRVRSKYRAEKQSNKVKNQIKPIIKPLHKYRGEKSKIRTDIVRSIPMRT